MFVARALFVITCAVLVVTSSAKDDDDKKNPHTTCKRMLHVLKKLLEVMKTYCKEMKLLLPCIEQGETCKKMTKMLDDLISETFKYCNFKIAKIPNDCADLFTAGCKTTGFYKVFMPTSAKITKVYCDMTTDGGGWLVFQKRFDGSVNFYRTWEAYKRGFGYLDGEYWFGNDIISEFANMKPQILRIDLGDFEGATQYAQYSTFNLKGESDDYELSATDFEGDAGDSLSYADGIGFSTKDRDHDVYDGSCAVGYKGGWWYADCHSSNLNGRYLGGKHRSYADGMEWSTWHGYYYSMKWTEMKIRPKAFKKAEK
ncbi:Fibrinogen C domain-containing protein 1-A [Lamellibrachia satsuma]|nr:Fibrinogen C domain-containing protein 1-A [Lamellibrachia satsuma]